MKLIKFVANFIAYLIILPLFALITSFIFQINYLYIVQNGVFGAIYVIWFITVAIIMGEEDTLRLFN